MTNQMRTAGLNGWAITQLRRMNQTVAAGFELTTVSDDASFRRYFRAQTRTASYIFVDAPPDREDSESFVKVAKLLAAGGLCVPKVFSADFEQGFMMLSDLGNRLYLDELDAMPTKSEVQNVNVLYGAAFDALYRMRQVDCRELPVYNESLLRAEMNLFPDWFLSGQMQIELSTEEKATLDSVFTLLVHNALEQPQGFVHRDYHSRNLMVVGENSPAIIDFQDAVCGPVTYDLVSLLKDCYWRFSRETTISWVREYWQMLALNVSFDQFLRWFDLMGMQRHLKCAGIFSRLHLRDGKTGYLNDIPLVVAYLLEVIANYSEFSALGDWLEQRILPDLPSKLRTRIES